MKFSIQYTETLYYEEMVDAQDCIEAKEMFENKVRHGIITNYSAEVDEYSISEASYAG